MALWSKLKDELDRAGRVAQGALDEGKIRLDSFRAKQLADRAAQALGYAVYRARQKGHDLDSDSYARLSSTLAGHEAEATQLEAKLSEVIRTRQHGDASARGGATDAGAPAEAAGAERASPSNVGGPTPGGAAHAPDAAGAT